METIKKIFGIIAISTIIVLGLLACISNTSVQYKTEEELTLESESENANVDFIANNSVTLSNISYIIGRSDNIGSQFNHVVFTHDRIYSWLKLEFFILGNENPVETIIFEETEFGSEANYYSNVIFTGRNLPFNIKQGAFGFYNAMDFGYHEFSIIGENGQLWRNIDETINIVLRP